MGKATADTDDLVDWRRETVETAAASWAREHPDTARRLVSAERWTIFNIPIPGTLQYLPPSAGLYVTAYGPAIDEVTEDADGDVYDPDPDPDEAAEYWN
jgi:hypothetical protein